MFQVRIEFDRSGCSFSIRKAIFVFALFSRFSEGYVAQCKREIVKLRPDILPDVIDILFDDEPCKWYIGVSTQTKVVKCNYFDSIHKKSKFTEAESKESCWLIQFGRQTSYLHFSPDLLKDKSFGANEKSSGGSRIFCWM